MRIAELVDESLVVWGAGREALSFANALQRFGFSEFCLAVDRLFDDRDRQRLERAHRKFPIFEGRAGQERIRNARHVVATPSIPPSNPLRAELSKEAGRLSTTFDLWMNEFGSRTIGVTGSKGKSTTSALVKALLDSAGAEAALGGNIGVPVWDLPDTASWFVVETSSFQAHGISASPRIGIVTALFPEHLDWHGNWDHYRASKWNLLAHGTELAVVGESAAVSMPSLPSTTEVAVVSGPDDWPPDLRDHLADVWSTSRGPWRYSHNRENAVLASYAAQRVLPDIQARDVLAAVGEFGGLPHRLEVVRDEGGIQWIDDSLATSPAPTLAALEALGGGSVTLISGGKNRGLDYQPLIDFLAHRRPTSILIGLAETGLDLVQALDGLIECHQAASIQSAVAIAADRTRSPGVVLFSPSAATPEGEGNFESRSSDFRDAIAEQFNDGNP